MAQCPTHQAHRATVVQLATTWCCMALVHADVVVFIPYHRPCICCQNAMKCQPSAVRLLQAVLLGDGHTVEQQALAQPTNCMHTHCLFEAAQVVHIRLACNLVKIFLADAIMQDSMHKPSNPERVPQEDTWSFSAADGDQVGLVS